MNNPVQRLQTATPTGPRPFEEVLAEWQEISATIARLKERELFLRTALAGAALSRPKEGINTIPLQDGRKVKITHKLNRKVDVSKFPQAGQMLAQLGVNRPIEAYFKQSWDVSKTLYDGAPDPVKRVLDSIITAKPAAPHIEVI